MGQKCCLILSMWRRSHVSGVPSDTEYYRDGQPTGGYGCRAAGGGAGLAIISRLGQTLPLVARLARAGTHLADLDCARHVRRC